MPDGTPLEQTSRVTQALGSDLGQQPDVINYQIYAGTSGPLQLQRTGAPLFHAAHAQPGRYPGESSFARISAKRRATPSHGGFARSSSSIGNQFGARIQVSEVPPGPPVMQTLVAEVYGPISRARRGSHSRSSRSSSTPPVLSTLTGTSKTRSPVSSLQVDSVKAAQHGISVADVASALALATSGMEVGLLHDHQSARTDPHRRAVDARRSLVRTGSRKSCIFPERTAPWCRCANWSRSSMAPSSAAFITRIFAAWCM